MNKKVYSKEELYSYGPQRSYDGKAGEAAFPLGGIGTGNVSIGSRGELRDWEIFNQPGKGNKLPYTFFAIWTKIEGDEPVTRVLESRLNPPYNQSHGYQSQELAGLPHLASSSLKAEYPFVNVDFIDDELPVKVSLEAFTPFIPLNADDSGIPGAIIRYKVKNTSDKKVDVSITGSLANMVGFKGYNIVKMAEVVDEVENKYYQEENIRGLFYSTSRLPLDHLKFGTMALMTRDKNTTVKIKWLNRSWLDGIQDFWDDLCEDGKLEKESEYNLPEARLSSKLSLKVSSLDIYHSLLPGEEKIFEFILVWHFPNRLKSWNEEHCSCGECGCSTIKNYYSTLFTDAWNAGRYLIENMGRLEKGSRDFHRAFFGSSLPSYVLDAVSSNITVLRSTTCFRIENGTFLGYEGCFENRGCCEGNCTHVWNYAQTLAFLFPELEQTMRKVEFGLETDENGKMAFRTFRVFGSEGWNALPAADGQMGTIVRLYRDWKISGNSDLVIGLWEKISKALDFAFDYWDTDRDCVLDSQQHNTYDIEFYGPNSLVNSLFFAALKAGSEMAEFIGDKEHSSHYRDAFEKGSRKMDEMLWGPGYYIQKIEDVNEYRYQYGQGCVSDQVFGQLLAHVAGLGYILPEGHVKQAIKSVFDYNFLDSFYKYNSTQRTYILNDEKGLLLCTWPFGGRPRLPFIYSDEVWTGIEYQVASHLIYEGFIDEGLTIIKAVRERHDGYRRNPWNEVECGNHYVRAMSSWSVILALSGFRYDLVKGYISFDPVINTDNFSTFWSTARAWGIYRQNKNPETGEREWEIETLYGSLEGIKVN